MAASESPSRDVVAASVRKGLAAAGLEMGVEPFGDDASLNDLFHDSLDAASVTHHVAQALAEDLPPPWGTHTKRSVVQAVTQCKKKALESPSVVTLIDILYSIIASRFIEQQE